MPGGPSGLGTRNKIRKTVTILLHIVLYTALGRKVLLKLQLLSFFCDCGVWYVLLTEQFSHQKQELTINFIKQENLLEK